MRVILLNVVHADDGTYVGDKQHRITAGLIRWVRRQAHVSRLKQHTCCGPTIKFATSSPMRRADSGMLFLKIIFATKVWRTVLHRSLETIKSATAWMAPWVRESPLTTQAV